MDIGGDNRLIIEDSDALDFRFVQSPNAEAGVLNPKNLIIHATEGQTVEGAIATFTNINRPKSIHLILGGDGKQLVQMLNFNAKAIHANEFNQDSLGIELDYIGHLTEKSELQHDFRHVSNFDPGSYIYAVAQNDGDPHNLRPWPCYPKAQMDALVPLARLLVDHYGLKIFGHEELKSFKLDPGPAFPMSRFKERVLGSATGSVVLDQTAQDLELRTGPGIVYPLLLGGRLTTGTPVSILQEHDGWVLVEVMSEEGGNSWLVGWAEIESIVAGHGTPEVKGNKLVTSDGRQYQYISPHPNNFDATRRLIEPKYIIMHITGGIDMSSTINWFRNEDAEVSAHLLIGRDGRVVQFVDFDTIAYHCGYSYWEGDFDLNRYSIGIELDNGAFLTPDNGEWKWKTTIIPGDEVQEAQHWKLNSKLGWHRFTDIQLNVAEEIIRALKKRYSIEIVLGHDVINLTERMDPGPLFPMERFRQAVSGDPGVLVQVHQAIADTPIYENPNQKPPNLDHPRHPGVLKAKSRIKVLLVKGPWTQIKVVGATGGLNKTQGWIPSNAVNTAQNNPKTKVDSEYYMLNSKAPAQAPPTFLKHSPLPAGTRLRIQKIEDDGWTLVSTIETVKGQKYLMGWVKADSLQFVGAEQMVYPPPAEI